MSGVFDTARRPATVEKSSVYVLGRRGGEAVAVLGLAAIAGWSSTGQTLRYINADAFLTLAGLALVSGVVIVGFRAPLVVYAALFVSFPLGDAARKLGSGDPRIILLRDVLLIAATLVLSLHVWQWADVRRACSPWLRPLCVFALWFGVASVNAAAFGDWRLPLTGARLYFEYLPLVGLGWFIVQEPARLRRALQFGLALLCVGTLVGVVQAVLGPRFLAPGSASSSEYFTHLELLRTTAGQGAAKVFQPTGLFVETGRYANWAFVNFALGLALIQQRGLRAWRFVVPAIGAIGVFASSGRTLIIASGLLAAIFGIRQLHIDSGRAVRLLLAGVVLFGTVAVATRTFYPALFESRVQFVGNSLNITSSTAEVSTRGPSYAIGTAKALRYGGLLGRGAGTQGLGRQYLGVEARKLTATEGGLAAIAMETGIVGLILWLTWTGACCREALRAARRAPIEVRDSLSTVAIAITIQMFLILWIGISGIQDFVLNAWFFLAVGVVAGFGAIHSPRAVLPMLDADSRQLARVEA